MAIKQNTKTRKAPEKDKRLFPEIKGSDMTVIDAKLISLLTAEGYAVVNTERIANCGFNNYTNVNRFELVRGDHDRVFFITHSPRRRAGQ
jgi:hypothetical protein